MEIHFLGTNGWHDSETGETPCVLIDAEEAYVVLDAGNALRKIDRHITDPEKPIFLFLSHFHLDHVIGLHALYKFDFRQGLRIYGQPGTVAALDRLLAKPFGAPLRLISEKYPVSAADLPEGRNSVGRIPVETRYLVHADPCFGYSLTLEGKKITYCTDTGSCPSMVELAKGADLLITECAWKKRNQYPGWPHLAPEDAADAAKASGAKRLVLMHFDAVNFTTHAEREEARKRAASIYTPVTAAEDDMVLSL
ncbi:MAG: ribonuclease Z [Candidatus Micrarchaeia archaeon]